MSSVRSARAVRVGTALGVGAVLAAGVGLLAAPRGLQGAVETAMEPAGLLIVAVCSFLIAVALPLPSEVVLAAPLDLGLPTPVTLALVIVVSALGRAAGSVVALVLGRNVSRFALAAFVGSAGRLLVRLAGVELFVSALRVRVSDPR